MIETKTHIIQKEIEKAVLVALKKPTEQPWQTEDHITELSDLAKTAGAEVLEYIIQERVSPDPATFIGKGKVQELQEIIEFKKANLVIFDDELSPAQVKNIEKILNVKIIDRTALILDIFADHAQTSEAKTQVELAQLNYMLPRLTRQWQHLSRQVGGIGTKGPGETQLETDRRLVRTRISKLKSRLKDYEKQNRVRRQSRDTFYRAALIGYTNAGKSTLMNVLSDAGVKTEDKLFATLDTTVRKINDARFDNLLISDTVGFIRKLPHELVASFRSTLAEAIEAELLLHVVDISHTHFEEHIEVVNSILDELSITGKEILLIFNKIDLLKNKSTIAQLKNDYPNAVFISAYRHIGIKDILKKLEHKMCKDYMTEEVKLNYSKANKEHLLRPIATILSKSSDDENLYLKIRYHKDNQKQVAHILSQ